MASAAGPQARAKSAQASTSGDVKIDDGDDALTAVLDNLAYVGFQPSKLREDLKQRGAKKEVMQMVAAYTQIGNNPSAAASARRKKPMPEIERLPGKFNTTLARVAIAFLPLLLLCRRIAKDKKNLQVRFVDCSVDPLYQDPAFSGWLGDEIMEFMVLFDAALSGTGNRNQHGVENVKRWMEVSRRGFENDDAVKAIMKKSVTNEEILQWFHSQF